MGTITDKLTSELFGELDGTVQRVEKLMDRTESLGKSFEKINVEREKAVALIHGEIVSELTKARVDLIRNSAEVLQKTADEAKAHAPTTYKIMAWSLQAAVVLTVAMGTYYYTKRDVINQLRGGYVDSDNNFSFKKENLVLDGTKIEGFKLNIEKRGGATLSVLPAAPEPVLTKTQQFFSAKNPWLMTSIGVLIGSVLTVLILARNAIMRAIETLIDESKRVFNGLFAKKQKTGGK